MIKAIIQLLLLLAKPLLEIAERHQRQQEQLIAQERADAIANSPGDVADAKFGGVLPPKLPRDASSPGKTEGAGGL